MSIDDILKNIPTTKWEKNDSLYSNMIMCWVNTGSDQFSNSEHFANIKKHLIWENKYIKGGVYYLIIQ